MQGKPSSWLGGLAVIAGLTWSPLAAADEELARPATMASQASATAAQRLNPFGDSRPLDDSILATRRGGTDAVNLMKLNGTVANNSATHVSTGSNAITDGALAGASGLPMVIQNSGNNVLIQNATIVNVQMK